MTNVEMQTVRTKLESRRRDLLAVLDNREDLYIERQADSIDDIINATNRDFAVMQINRNARSLRDIDAAIERVNDGTYGMCGDCEEPISPRRLAAIPWATLCVRCQENADRRGQHEHGHVHFEDEVAMAA